jgi:hypothetical protein
MNAADATSIAAQVRDGALQGAFGQPGAEGIDARVGGLDARQRALRRLTRASRPPTRASMPSAPGWPNAP